MILLSCMLCTTLEAFKILDAQALINRVVPSHCFANRLAEQGISDYWTNQLQGANERLNIRFKDLPAHVVGQTYLYSRDIELNKKIHARFTTCQTASNITHELTHTLGYAHKADVGYAVNYAFEQCCMERN